MRGGSADHTVAGGDLGGVGEALTGGTPLVGAAGDGGVGIAGDRAASLLIGKNATSKCAPRPDEPWPWLPQEVERFVLGAIPH